MATPEFILQGFTASTHIDVLQRLFDLPDIQSVLVSVAFVTEGGVEQSSRARPTAWHRGPALHRGYWLPDSAFSSQAILGPWD
jgi:hypothetical protein